MTRDNIIKLAREAGWSEILLDLATEIDFGRFTRFAALVAAAEREACALIAETPVSGEQDDITMGAKDRVAAAIRARGQE